MNVSENIFLFLLIFNTFESNFSLHHSVGPIHIQTSLRRYLKSKIKKNFVLNEKLDLVI